MRILLQHPWLAVAVPAALALIVAVFGRRLGRAVPWVTALGPLLVVSEGISAMIALVDPARLGGVALGSTGAPWAGRGAFAGSFTWMAQGGTALTLGWALDGLAAVMLAVVGGVALMVVVFSIGYMHAEKGLPRYFALISAFVAAMCGLVLADSLVGLFLAWELVGACSYLLIGFWYDRPEASRAAIKAFLTTRVGDMGLLAGLAVLWTATGSLALTDIAARVPGLPAGVATAAALLLFLGAAGKSAQFPLHVWLPDAMAGPTPVSALIHAATMVAAGVFLIARVWPLFEASPVARGVVLTVGVVTALGAAVAAAPQTDIKRVLAYSTISQLGFMFAALGAGAWPVALFHLVTHAAFKALLFLSAGSLIHSCGSQDVADMGGLLRRMPVTGTVWLVGAAALAGLPPLSGFVSKDEVLHAVLAANPIAAAALFVAAGFTAFYAYRVSRLAFFGEYRGAAHPHESGPEMVVPLLVLAGFASLLGGAAPALEAVLGTHAEPFSPAVALGAVAALVVGAVSAAVVYRDGLDGDDAMRSLIGRRWDLARRGFAIDALYGRAFVRPAIAASRALYENVDAGLVDRLVELTAPLAQWASARLAALQNGDARRYAALMGLGVVALVAASLWMGR